MISAVVLAAGSSSRFGGNKLVGSLHGAPVANHVADAALGSGVHEVVVVVGYEREAIEAVLPSDDRLRVVFNPDHAQGMSTSLRAGLDALADDCEGAVILLADQPSITARHIDAVVSAALSEGAVAARASYGGRVGHPVFLGRSVWPSLTAVAGDRGAAPVLDRLSGVVAVGLPGPSPRDVDTPDDLQALRDRL